MADEPQRDLDATAVLEEYHRDIRKIHHEHIERRANIERKMGTPDPESERIVDSLNSTATRYEWTGRLIGTLAGGYPLYHLYRRNMRRYEYAMESFGRAQIRHFRPVVGLYLAGAALGIATGTQIASLTASYFKEKLRQKTALEHPAFKRKTEEIARMIALDQAITERDQLTARIKLMEASSAETLHHSSTRSTIANTLAQIWEDD
ncbi:hypothetical protein TWF730_000637 [Orbilia blumenaviensis]|uniref:Uncharacterized protein n=1 Tax=Orbilia blumenaviensis TaxID=1796055 RepID=A0AAV9VMC3_9PEZI